MKKLLSIAFLAFVGLTFGQEDGPKFNVTGSVDAYFKANLSSGNDGPNNVSGNSGDLSAFNNDSGFSAGLANPTIPIVVLIKKLAVASPAPLKFP